MNENAIFNFVGQRVSPVNGKPTAFCPMNGKLAVAFDSPLNSIEVFDLNDDLNTENVVQISPFNHSIKQLLYCEEGNYFATFGRRIRDNRELNDQPVVDVIFNWWIQERPFVVRVAGSDPPETSSVTSLEIVELPVDEVNVLNLKFIECCRKSGNLLICYGILVSVFKFEKTTEHPFSRSDFTHIMNIRLSFMARKVRICEHFMAFMSRNHVQIVLINMESKGKETVVDHEDNERIHADDCLDWNIDDKKASVFVPSLYCQSANESTSVLSHLPEVLGPVSDKCCCKVKVNGESCGNKARNVFVEVLVCRFFYESEYLDNKCDVIDVNFVPVYKVEKANVALDPLCKDLNRDKAADSTNLLHSSSFSSLISCGCFISTKSYCCLYSLKESVERTQSFYYEETAKAVAVEETVVHVLTENTLRTYSLNLLNSIFGLKSKKTPLLLNVRLFMGAEYIFNSTHHVLLISRNLSENNSHTVYSLKKPSLRELHADIVEFCDLQMAKHQSDVKIDLLHYMLVTFRLLQITQIYHNRDEEMRHLMTCLMLVNALSESCPEADLKSIVQYVFKGTKIDLNCALSSTVESNEIKLEIVRLNINQRGINDLNHDNVFTVLNLTTEEDVDLIKAIVYNFPFEKHDKEKVLNFLRSFNFEGKCLLEAKLYFTCGEFEEINALFAHVNDEMFLNSLTSNHELMLTSTEFVAFIATQKSDIFIEFCVWCLENRFYSVSQLCDELISSPSMLTMFLDALFCNYQSYSQLDSELTTHLADSYMNIILRKNDFLHLKLRGKLCKKEHFLELILPFHEESDTCLCSECCPEYEKLHHLLYATKCEKAIAVVEKRLRSEEGKRWEALNIYALEYNDALELIYQLNADAVIPFTADPRNTFPNKWRAVFENVEKKFNFKNTENTTIHAIFNHLSESLSPQEFIDLVPNEWNEIAKNYILKCIRKHESQELKDQIAKLGLELKSIISST